jgi:hypothetical protein
MAPFRKVVRREVYRPAYTAPGAQTVKLVLACGHSVWRKGSQGSERQQKARCGECPR